MYCLVYKPELYHCLGFHFERTPQFSGYATYVHLLALEA